MMWRESYKLKYRQMNSLNSKMIAQGNQYLNKGDLLNKKLK